jgi:hypothetical protein
MPSYRLGASFGSKSRSGSATRGIAYHRKVYRQLEALAADGDGRLLVEPWFQRIDDCASRTMCQPDAVIHYEDERSALVVEVKMNWKAERDEKLLSLYLPVVRSALDLEVVWPVVIVGCLRGGRGPKGPKPLLGLAQLDQCLAWQPGSPTPLLLLP